MVHNFVNGEQLTPIHEIYSAAAATVDDDDNDDDYVVVVVDQDDTFHKILPRQFKYLVSHFEAASQASVRI